MQRVMTVLCTLSFAFANVCIADDVSQTYVQPGNLQLKTGSEYYSTDANNRVIMPVRVWGEVNLGGKHFVPINSTLADVVSVAGGPTARASLSDITIYRNDEEISADLYDKKWVNYRIVAQDTVFVDYSIKKDLPLIFTGISTVVSVLTLYFVTAKN